MKDNNNTNTSQSIQPDIEHAQRFLTLLDEEAEVFTFQTFAETSQAKRNPQRYAKTLTGTLDKHAQELVQLNKAGAGIFVTVQETDGTGRKAANITRIRAIFQEDDDGFGDEFPIEPHITVQSSPDKYHRYFLTEDAPLDEFEAVQLRMVEDYGSDPAAKDRARVLRLPGFYHQKNPDKPYMVRIVGESLHQPILWSELKQHFPPVQRQNHVSKSVGEQGSLTQPALVMSALEHLDPDMEYLDWLRVGMALHSTGGSWEAFDIWDQWSTKGKKYRSGETAQKWESFASNCSNCVTLGTLFHMACKEGWPETYSTSPQAKRAIARERQRRLDEFSSRYGIAMVQGKAVVVYREFDENSCSYTTQYSSVRDLKQKYASDYLPKLTTDRKGSDVVEHENIVDVWYTSPLRKTYDQVVFKPEPGKVAGDLALPDEQNLNLYQGLAINPKAGGCPLMLKHIWEIWCKENQSLYDYVMSWLANMFQNPGQPGYTVLVLKSGEGAGKNIIIDGLVDALGRHATPVVRPDQLTGRFNDHLATSVLIFANEAVWGGDKSQEGALKSLITDRDLPIERKHLPVFRVKNCVHLIMATNNDWFAPVGLDDRRYVVMELDEKRKNDFPYFTALNEEMESGGLEAFVDRLLKRDLSSFNVRKLPVHTGSNDAKFNAKMKSVDPVTRWWVHCLIEEQIRHQSVCETENIRQHNYQTDLARQGWFKNCWDSGSIRIRKDQLHEAYRQWARNNGERVEHNSVFFRALGSLCKYSESRPEIKKGCRPRVLEFPPLWECKVQLHEALGCDTPLLIEANAVGCEIDSPIETASPGGADKLRKALGANI